MSVCLGPSPARDVVVDARHLGELDIAWQPPVNPNGLVTHYMVYWQRQLFEPEKYHQRNYCDDSTYIHCHPLDIMRAVMFVWRLKHGSDHNLTLPRPT